jgi:hypothetical protein
MTVLSDRRLATIMLEAGFPAQPRVIAEGLGVIHAESGGNPSEDSQGASGHIGLWAEEPSYGTAAERLDPLKSTIAARKSYEEKGWGAWAPYETREAEGTGPSRAPKYMAVAEQAINAAKGKIGNPKGWPPTQTSSAPATSSSGGTSGPMKFLMTAALVLGGFALVALGAMRAIGQRRFAEAAA